MGKVYKLDIDKSLVHQVLEYAGWHKGRKVDIEKIEKYNSIFDYLEYNFRHYLGNEIYVTFKNQRDLENNRY